MTYITYQSGYSASRHVDQVFRSCTVWIEGLSSRSTIESTASRHDLQFRYPLSQYSCRVRSSFSIVCGMHKIEFPCQPTKPRCSSVTSAEVLLVCSVVQQDRRPQILKGRDVPCIRSSYILNKPHIPVVGLQDRACSP